MKNKLRADMSSFEFGIPEVNCVVRFNVLTGICRYHCSRSNLFHSAYVQ